ncbi:hypothetical protein K469DRAFT_715214 [Zopfia rhizophila CBS 207.26]|uniref:Uncharacterized protein n=1 Tax=Zopfia rhizophila CBS 207.26 TaxID=1314779 RepID=A0A6A6EQB0_9PEZI|nr:hypothetical protein K469DRAFT_715214 [Zopfia rhizophila CBS 207.26]
MEFVAIPHAKQFHPEEYDNWANYIPMEGKESTWDLYYVLLIEYRSDIVYRVGLGKVYKEAFEKLVQTGGQALEGIHSRLNALVMVFPHRTSVIYRQPLFYTQLLDLDAFSCHSLLHVLCFLSSLVP